MLKKASARGRGATSELLAALGALAEAQESRRPASVIRRLTTEATAAFAAVASGQREARAA